MPEEIDYKALLIKYMAWVGYQEGGYFLSGLVADSPFSQGEVDGLLALTPEADKVEFFK